MDDTRLPKIIFYSELEHGTRSRGGQLKRYKDMLKTNMRVCDVQRSDLSPTNEFICDPEIRRDDGSVQQHYL